MNPFLGPAYEWFKAAHIVSVIAWMGFMLALPHVYARHAELEADDPAGSALGELERRLLRLMAVGLVATWLLGILLLVTQPGLLKQGWMHGKLLLVVILSGGHGFLSVARKRFAEGRNGFSPGGWRGIAAVPALLVVIVVFLVRSQILL